MSHTVQVRLIGDSEFIHYGVKYNILNVKSIIIDGSGNISEIIQLTDKKLDRKYSTLFFKHIGNDDNNKNKWEVYKIHKGPLEYNYRGTVYYFYAKNKYQILLDRGFHLSIQDVDSIQSFLTDCE